jgi:hypothetical protein
MEDGTNSMRKGKTLYAVLWVDDYSSFPLPRAKRQWFERNAGPLSLGVEIDQRFPRPFTPQLDQLRKDTGPPSHYLGHHYHPLRFRGHTGIKRIYDLFKLRYFISFSMRTTGILRSLKVRQTKGLGPNKTLAFLGAGLMLVLLIAILYLGIWSDLFLLLLLAPYAVLIGLIGLVLFVHLERNWVHDFSDWEWNSQFLRELKGLFEKRDQRYSPVVRHGLNTPPASSMEFYLTNMQLLADASATPTPREGNSGRGTRRLRWQVTQPYYASLSQDYNVIWNGIDEEDRGILELPVNLGNIAQHGFGEFEKQMVEGMPEGGLVSAFMHGWDDFSAIENWVNYLKHNYDVRFVRADEYAKIYMKQNPRPVLIDGRRQPCWAFKRGDSFHAIREIDDGTISVCLTISKHSSHQMLLKTGTDKPTPEIFVDSLRIKSAEPRLDMVVTGAGTLLRQVQGGTYCLEIEDIDNLTKVDTDEKSMHHTSQILSTAADCQ